MKLAKKKRMRQRISGGGRVCEEGAQNNCVMTSKSLKRSFERWLPITYSILYVFPAWSLRLYFRRTQQLKQTKIILTALGNAKYSEKKSCRRPSTLQSELKYIFAIDVKTLYLSFWTAKGNNTASPHPLHLSSAMWVFVLPQIVTKQPEKWWKPNNFAFGVKLQPT